MLLKSDNTSKINYLADWPSHYYEIETASQRKECLSQALEQKLSPEADTFRMELLEKRFFSGKGGGSADSFMHAYMMIKASSGTGISILNKKRLQKELCTYQSQFCLDIYNTLDAEKQAILIAEWSDFARLLLHSCTSSRSYCSTLFGMIPIKDTSVAQKIAEEIQLVTVIYPKQLGFETVFSPLNKVLVSTFCEIIENGPSYFSDSMN